MNREQIKQELRDENPFSHINGILYTTGDVAYEELLEQWTDARVEQAQPTLAERRASMAVAFDALPLTVQASFYSSRMTAEAAMDRNRFDIARTIIEAVEVPVELEATKATILSYFPN